MPSELSEQEREALDYLVRMALGHDYADGVKITEAEFTIETGFARIRDEAVAAAVSETREQVARDIEALRKPSENGERPYGYNTAVRDVLDLLRSGATPSDAVTQVEDGCTCGGMAACPQCQDRDASPRPSETGPDEELRERVEAVLFQVESVHHFHGEDCLCGFSSSRSRSRTEHITGLVRAALGGETPKAAGSSPSEEAWGRETPHTLTEYGTTNCAVEHVRAEVNDGECSACGAQVPAPSEKRCHCGDSLCTCAYPEPPRCDDENCHGECESPAPSERDAEEREVDEHRVCPTCGKEPLTACLPSNCTAWKQVPWPARPASTEGVEGRG